MIGFPLKGTLLNPTSGSLKRDLIERLYITKGLCIAKGPPNPNAYLVPLKVIFIPGHMLVGFPKMCASIRPFTTGSKRLNMYMQGYAFCV